MPSELVTTTNCNMTVPHATFTDQRAVAPTQFGPTREARTKMKDTSPASADAPISLCITDNAFRKTPSPPQLPTLPPPPPPPHARHLHRTTPYCALVRPLQAVWRWQSAPHPAQARGPDPCAKRESRWRSGTRDSLPRRNPEEARSPGRTQDSNHWQRKM